MAVPRDYGRHNFIMYPVK